MKRNRTRLYTGSLAAAAMLAAGALHADQHEARPGEKAHAGAEAIKSMTPREFVQQAAMSGQLEVQAGQLAQQKAQNQQVKELGATLVRDHQQANEKLMAVARDMNVQLSRELDEKHREKLSKIQDKTGQEFDREFVKHAARHHQMDIAKFEHAARQFQQEQQLHSFIQQTLPVLRNHLRMTQSAAQAIGLNANELGLEGGAAVGAPGGAIRGEAEVEIDREPRTQEREPRTENRPEARIQERPDDREFATRQEPARAGIVAIERADQEGEAREQSPRPRAGIVNIERADQEAEAREQSPRPATGIVAIERDEQPRRDAAGFEAEARLERDEAAGGPAGTVTGRAESGSSVRFEEAPARVKSALREHGFEQQGQLKKVTVYEASVNGITVHVTEEGKVLSEGQPRR